MRTPREVADEWFMALRRRDAGRAAQLYAPTVASRLERGEQPRRGRLPARAGLEKLFSFFEHAEVYMDNVMLDEGRVAFEWYAGNPNAAGPEPALCGCVFFEVTEGLITGQRLYWNMAHFEDLES